MKKVIAFICACMLTVTLFICGCTIKFGSEGRDGKDGQDVSILDIYEKAKEVDGNADMTFDEFLKKYLSYTDSQLADYADLQTSINRSLMSTVSILARFKYSSGLRSVSYKVFAGSGVIIRLDKEAGDALIVTNNHVVYSDTADDVYCKDLHLYLYGQDEQDTNYSITYDNEIIDDDNYCISAEVIGASTAYDIALLKVTGSEVIKRSDARATSLRDDEDVFVGEQVYAVGNASGEGMSAVDGKISKDSEYITVYVDDNNSQRVQYRVMRTTAAINGGNSGGGLFDTDGKLVGIVNAKDEAEGIDNKSYALPASTVRRVLQLMYDSYESSDYTLGRVNRAMLNVTLKIADRYSRFNNTTGLAEIFEVVKIDTISAEPAQSYLLTDDIIKSITVVGSDEKVKEQVSVTRQYHVQNAMLSVRKGDTVKLVVERAGEEREVSVLFNSDSYFTKT